MVYAKISKSLRRRVLYMGVTSTDIREVTINLTATVSTRLLEDGLGESAAGAKPATLSWAAQALANPPPIAFDKLYMAMGNKQCKCACSSL